MPAASPKPFPTDPWTGDKVQLFNMLEKPVMESGGGGLVSTTMDYARFCQMLLNGGTLDGNRIIGRKTLELMASDHLGPERQGRFAADAGRSRLWPRLRRAHRIRAWRRSRARVGQFFWSGMAGTFFWIDPDGRAVRGVHDAGPRPARIYSRTLLRDLVYAAVE